RCLKNTAVTLKHNENAQETCFCKRYEEFRLDSCSFHLTQLRSQAVSRPEVPCPVGYISQRGDNPMRPSWKLVAVGVFVTMCLRVGMAAEQAKSATPAEVKVKPEELPKAVSTALNTRFPGLKITSAAKETENSNVIFDIELTQNGRKFESDIKE